MGLHSVCISLSFLSFYFLSLHVIVLNFLAVSVLSVLAIFKNELGDLATLSFDKIHDLLFKAQVCKMESTKKKILCKL